MPKFSGKEIIKILVNEFGFEISRQRGDHVVLRKFYNNQKIVTVVPLHKEVKVGTFLGLLKLAKISEEEFLKKLE